MTGRAVDDFVEQAADALRALDEAVAETLRAAGGGARRDRRGDRRPGVVLAAGRGVAVARGAADGTARIELAERTDRLRRDPGAAATVADLDADLRLLDTVVDRLDASGSALQRFAQELAEIAESVRRLEGAAAAAGLELDGLRVVEPWGVLTTELAQQRHRAQPDLQRQADRLAEPARPGSGRHDQGHGRGHGGRWRPRPRVARTRSLR